MTQDEQVPTAAVLLDMDGVLCENTFRREYGDDRDYALFGRRCGNAAPNMDFICFARSLKLDNIVLFVLTARSEKLRTITMTWLNHYGVSVKELHMRPLGNRLPDHLLKQKMLAAIKRKHALGREGGLLPLLAVDDDENVVRMYKDENIPACLPGNVPEVMI